MSTETDLYDESMELLKKQIFSMIHIPVEPSMTVDEVKALLGRAQAQVDAEWLRLAADFFKKDDLCGTSVTNLSGPQKVA